MLSGQRCNFFPESFFKMLVKGSGHYVGIHRGCFYCFFGNYLGGEKGDFCNIWWFLSLSPMSFQGRFWVNHPVLSCLLYPEFLSGKFCGQVGSSSINLEGRRGHRRQDGSMEQGSMIPPIYCILSSNMCSVILHRGKNMCMYISNIKKGMKNTHCI